MSDCKICNRVGPPLVTCTVCGLYKAPRGRSVPLETAGSYCDYDCSGYYAEPYPDELWPNEKYGASLGHTDWHETR